MSNANQHYQLTASDFLLFVRRQFRFLLLFGLIGAVSLVAALRFSSRATVVDDKPALSSQVVYIVEGFGVLRQTLSLVGVTDDASARLFFPASSDVLKQFELKRNNYDLNDIARSCSFLDLGSGVEVNCKRGSLTAEAVRALVQKSYDSLFKERFGPIVALLTRHSSNSNSNQLTEVVNLLADPPSLTVRVLDGPSTTSLQQSATSVSPISFTFQNAATLGLGGAFVGVLMALLTLFVVAVRSRKVISMETLRRCVPTELPVLDLVADGPDLVGLELRRLVEVSNDGYALLTLGIAAQHDSLIEISKICDASGQAVFVPGDLDEQVKTLIGLSTSHVVIACAVGKTKIADLTRVLRAAELSSRRVIGVVGAATS